MLRITRNRKLRISDRLAVFAATLLVVTSLSGVGSSTFSAQGGETLGSVVASADLKLANRASSANEVKKNRKFKINLFLFRNN